MGKIGLRLSILLLLSCFTAMVVAEIFKYQDENGRWHFTDKKPKDNHETITIDKPKAKYKRPGVVYDSERGNIALAQNPLVCPIELIVFDQENQQVASVVVEPLGDALIERAGKPLVWDDAYYYYYYLGKPGDSFDMKPMHPPIPPRGKYKITQGFQGPFSHSKEPNTYAIDIAMKIGETIHAARGGHVVWVKDDYHMGGRDEFFADKANYIKVVHSDGTIATYAHILLGSAKVKPGDRVNVGQPLAMAGTSGYSTGPHLHFVVHENKGGGEIRSVAFTFKSATGTVSPKVGKWLTSNGIP